MPRITQGKKMCIVICDDKKIIICLNFDSMVKDLLLKHGGERRIKVQTFTFALQVGGVDVQMGKVLNLGQVT